MIGGWVLEELLENCLLISLLQLLSLVISFLVQEAKRARVRKRTEKGTREWVSYSCFYLSCRCNAFGPNANRLGHTRFIQIDLALLSGNGLLNVNFRINSARAAQTVTLCLGEVGWGGGGGGGGCAGLEERGNSTIAWNFQKDPGVWFSIYSSIQISRANFLFSFFLSFLAYFVWVKLRCGNDSSLNSWQGQKCK